MPKCTKKKSEIQIHNKKRPPKCASLIGMEGVLAKDTITVEAKVRGILILSF